MITATVTDKLACEFVREVSLYLLRTKYVVNLCLDDIQYYFSKHKLATSMVDCLTHEDECELTIVASTIPIEPTIPPIITDCQGLTTITLSSVGQYCNYTVGLKQLNGTVSSFPTIVIEDDTVYQPAYINVVATGCGETFTETIESGCYNSTPPTCLESYNIALELGFQTDAALLHSSGYVKTLRVYETNSIGVLVNTPIDLNVSPSNVTAWTACPLCTGVTGAELFFGHANWHDNFKELLDNVSYTMYGELNADWVVNGRNLLNNFNNAITIGNRVKHNPADEWLGLNMLNLYIEWVDSSGITHIVNPTINDHYYTSTFAHMSEEFTFETVCGDITGKVVLANGTTGYNVQASNFNFLSVNSLTLNKAATIENLVTQSCTKIFLTAVYTTSSPSVLIYWTNEDDDVISETSTAIVTESGTYTFTVQSGDGCFSQESITV